MVKKNNEIYKTPQLILASSSPRRRDILKKMGVSFKIIAPNVDESILHHESPRDYVRRVALAKAEAVRRAFPHGRAKTYFLGVDTIVVLQRSLLGKPSGPVEAAQMLTKLSGRTHEVMSACSLIHQSGRIIFEEVETSRVTLRPLNAQEIKAYVETGEPLDKAGAYALQGLASQFVRTVDGSRDNVVGLPTQKLKICLKKLGMVRIHFKTSRF